LAKTRGEVGTKIQSWGSGTKNKVFDFLEKGNPPLAQAEKDRYFAILLNTSEGRTEKALKRLTDYRAGNITKRQYLDAIDDELRSLETKIASVEARGGSIAKYTKQKSELNFERQLIAYDDQADVAGIFFCKSAQ
jgi:hypothetical protein